MSDWWARALSNTPQQPVNRSPLPPLQPRPVVAPDPQSYRPPQPYQAPIKARHVAGSSTCPECGSGNYMRQQGNYSRCFDCGYPVMQSTSGLIAEPGSPSQPAQQIATTYNPTIEGHI